MEAMTLEQVRDWHRANANAKREDPNDEVPCSWNCHALMADAIDAHLAPPAQAMDVGVRPICQNSAESAEVLTYSSKPAIEVAAAWRLRIGSSDVWSFCTEEWQADFYGKQSGLPYEKQPLYTRALSGEKAGPVGDDIEEGCTPADAVVLRKANHALAGEIDMLREALQFYAEGNHFLLADKAAWDTVTGEPQNYQCDEAGTATVEDGTVARQALALPASPTPDKEVA